MLNDSDNDFIDFLNRQCEIEKNSPLYVEIPWPLPPMEIEPPPPRNRKLEKTWFKKLESRVSKHCKREK
jgi:hypothetical protein